MRVGLINYINTLPFALPLTKNSLCPEAQFSFGIPSELNQAMREGSLEISLMSSAEYLKNELKSLSMIEGYGIAAHHSIESVNLYVRRGIPRLDASRVGLTHHSAASAALLKVLCHHFWHVKPHFEILNRAENFENYEGFLLIGDEALQQPKIENFYTIDLATAWYEKTSLPFVFALFAVQRDFLEQHKSSVLLFQKALSHALDWSAKHEDTLLERAARQSALPLSTLKNYYRLCHYRLDSEAQKSLKLFSALLKEI